MSLRIILPERWAGEQNGTVSARLSLSTRQLACSRICTSNPSFFSKFHFRTMKIRKRSHKIAYSLGHSPKFAANAVEWRRVLSLARSAYSYRCLASARQIAIILEECSTLLASGRDPAWDLAAMYNVSSAHSIPYSFPFKAELPAAVTCVHGEQVSRWAERYIPTLRFQLVC